MIPEPQRTYVLELLKAFGPAADDFAVAGAQAMKFILGSARATKDIDFVLDVIRLRGEKLPIGAKLQELGYTVVEGSRNFQFEKVAQLMVYVSGASASKIVDPGEVDFLATAPGASPDELRALASVAEDPLFSRFCRRGKGGTWSLFTGTIKYADEDPVQQVSSIAAKLLLALDDAYERASHPAPVSTRKQKAAGAHHA